jgi:hypothetical protein
MKEIFRRGEKYLLIKIISACGNLPFILPKANYHSAKQIIIPPQADYHSRFAR